MTSERIIVMIVCGYGGGGCGCGFGCACAHMWARDQSTLWDPVDYSPPGSSVHGIFQTRILEWVAISFSRGSSQLRDRTWVSCVSCTGRQILCHCTMRKAHIVVIK